MDKITTNEEYLKCLEEKKILRDQLFNLKIELFMNKNNLEKVKLLEEKQKVLITKNKKIIYKIKEYEQNLEIKKEGKIK